MNINRPRLPQADPWDKQTGLQPVAEFLLTCAWTPITEDWATVTTYIELDGTNYALSRQVDIRRIYRDTKRGRVEAPELLAYAWTKKMLGSGGVVVLEMGEANPGHILEHPSGTMYYKWMATVGSRLSVAIAKLDGMARLVPVE